MTTVRMNAAAIGGTINLNFSGPVTVPASGVITVDSRDSTTILRAGGSYISVATAQNFTGAAIAGAAGKIVASAALTNSTYVIANQPDFPRGVSVRVDPGTIGFTSGQLVVSYIANDGTSPQLDTISLVGAPGTTIISTNLSKGVVHMNSLVASSIGGGASPGVQMDTLNFLAAIVGQGFVDFSVLKLTVDAAESGVASTIASSGLFLPSTIPNSTHTYNAVVTYAAAQA